MRTRLAAVAAVFAAAACTTPDPAGLPSLVATSDILKRAVAPVDLRAERPIGFSDAVARGLAENLDLRVAALESVIARGAIDLQDLSKLPTLLATAGYTHRRPPGAETDKDPVDEYRRTRQAELAWNSLDLGIAFVRAKQAANDALAADERRRRMANAIVNELRFAYWTSALGARRLPELAGIGRDIETAMERSRKLGAARLQDPLVSLEYQAGLLELQRQVRGYESEVTQARLRLARLLNAHPGTNFTLTPAAPEESFRAVGGIDQPTLEDVALVTRSEVHESEYAVRNRRLDVIGAYLVGLPSLRLRAAWIRDTSFEDPTWRETGYSFTWNVLGILTSLERASIARQGVSMAEVRRLALALSVMEQVAVARDQLKLHDDDYGNARDSAEVRRRIYEMRRDRVPFGENDELERIRAALAAVLAQIREDRAYATLQKTYGELLASIGIDQFPEGLDLGSPQAAAAIERHLSEVPRRVQELSARIAEERRRSAEAKK